MKVDKDFQFLEVFNNLMLSLHPMPSSIADGW